MAQTAINPDTGERLQWDQGAGQWVPAPPMQQTATQAFERKMQELPFAEQALIGIGRGMSNVGRQIGNIVGLTPDEVLASYRELDRPLMETTGGHVGSVGGEIAALAPLAGGSVAAGARGLGAMMPTVRTAMGATRTGQAATGAGLGLAEGAIEGAVLGGPGQRDIGAAEGGLLGAAGGSVLPLMVRGFRTPSESAQTLMGMTPSPDLTPGMMSPDGILNQLEQAAGSIPGGRTLIERARETPQRQFAQAMVNEGLPPGAQPIAPQNVNTMLAKAYMAFEPAYAQLKGHAVPRTIASELASDFVAAADSSKIAATQDLRNAVKKYLEDQVTQIDDINPTTTDLIDVRSNIREEARLARKADDRKELALYEAADEAITKRINKALPAGLDAVNKAVDLQYAKHKLAEDAIYKMGNREFPTNTQWQNAIRAATNKKEFAHGGGLLREYSEAASDVFKVTEPKTGSRLATLGPLLGAAGGLYSGALSPEAALTVGGPLAILAGTKGGRRFAVGEMDIQKLMQRMGEPRTFMEPGIPTIPGQYLRSILPIATAEERNNTVLSQ